MDVNTDCMQEDFATMTRRLIESTFPIKEVGREATREKRIRKGHISTLFRWWARRPLASSRATNLAALVPKPPSREQERNLNKFIVELSRWENSTNEKLLQNARELILQAHQGIPPVVLDPFSGGGSIPLEALRLGCETHATDYNPVAVLLLKCTLEYPQKYKHELIKELKKWGTCVLERIRRELSNVYNSNSPNLDLKGKNGKNTSRKEVLGYLWAWSIRCLNPNCNLRIPLFKHYWLARKTKKQIYLHPHVTNNQVSFTVEENSEEKEIKGKKYFNPTQATVSRANVTCPACGSIIPAKQVRQTFLEKKATPMLVAVVEKESETRKKTYRIATEDDEKRYQMIEEMLQQKLESFQQTHGFYPLPREKLPPKDTLGFRVQRYGMLEWQDLFNARQKLFFITAMDAIIEVKTLLYKKNDSSTDANLNEAIITYLAMLMVDLARYNSVLNRWVPESESLAEVFGRQAFSMIWNHIENNPLGSHGGTWERRLTTLIQALEHLITIERSAASVSRANATQLPFDDESFDAVFTDPPYYDNVPYSYLSDFFYVWLKRLLGDVYPDLFFASTVPKKNDLVAYSHKNSFKEAKIIFERELARAFKEIHRVLKPNGVGIILYAHKTTAGWEAVINALLQSGLSITAAWPIATEQQGRLRAKESAALATTTYIIVRKFKKKPLGIYSEVKQSLEYILVEKLRTAWKEGISGADFFIAAIGGGLEAFGIYDTVIDHSGVPINASRILEDIRRAAIKITMSKLFKSEILSKIGPLTQFYVTWRWCFQDQEVPFDEAKKLAQSLGISLENYWNQVNFLQKRKDRVKLLGPDEIIMNKSLKLETTRQFDLELIHVLHELLLTWELGNSKQFSKILKQHEDEREVILVLAQAIAETLSIENKERKMLEHFLSFMRKY